MLVYSLLLSNKITNISLFGNLCRVVLCFGWTVLAPKLDVGRNDAIIY